MSLTELKVRNAKAAAKPGKVTDGNGMHLLMHLLSVSYRVKSRKNRFQFLVNSTLCTEGLSANCLL